MPETTALPNRWLHLKFQRAFSDAEFELFKAQARIWVAYVRATLEVWPGLGIAHQAPVYRFFPPELSADRTTATLPIGGDWTLASRALFEAGASYLLWQHFPAEVQRASQEGLSEEHGGATETHWRPARRFGLPHADSHAEQLPASHEHPSVLDTARRALWWVSGILPRA